MNPDEEIDHIDGNPLNNTRGNLRVVSHKKNMENLAAASRFRGTCWDKRKGMWMAKVTHNYRTCFCGYFHDRDEAAKAAEAKRRSFDFLTSSAD